jgi:hypothetical protein
MPMSWMSAESRRARSQLQHVDVEPFGGKPLTGQVDAVQFAVVVLAVLQVIEDLQGGAERVGGGIACRVLAMQIQQVAPDRVGGEAAVAEQFAPVGVAQLHRVLLEGGDQVSAARTRHAGSGEAFAQAAGLLQAGAVGRRVQ